MALIKLRTSDYGSCIKYETQLFISLSPLYSQHSRSPVLSRGMADLWIQTKKWWLSPTPLSLLTVVFFSPSSHLQGALFILLFKVKCFSPSLSPDAKRLKPRYRPHMQCLLGCNSQWKMPPQEQEPLRAFYLSQYATSPPPPPCFHFQLHVISFQLFNLILSALFLKNLLFHPKALEGKETHTF